MTIKFKLALSLAEYFGLPVEAIFSKQPLLPLSQQVYGMKTESGKLEKQA